MTWATAVMTVYLMILGLLSLHGLHRLWMLYGFSQRPVRGRRPAPEVWPMVTVQLPMFNERFVAKRLIEATGKFDYPRDKLFIQVLDDSTDDTLGIAQEAVDALVEQGWDAALVHREDRTGFKAGALDEGLDSAKGDFVAVFDADFIPTPDFLKATVPWFDEGIGMVQARWGHINAKESWLTAAQATLLDGHFVVEHTARNATGRWFNFNGTAGVWRRETIADAGGWEHDTLTEDLDLSYRAQLKGWKFVYLYDLVAPAELPPNMAAFKTQQHRWAKGSIQTAKKLMGRIWGSSIPFHVKVEATLHLTANFSYPLVVVLSILLPWAVYARITGGLEALLVIDAVLFSLAILPFLAFYGAAVWHSGGGPRGGRLARLPVVLALGMGMAVSQTRAVIEALVGPVGTFVRTPKTGGLSVAATYRAATRGLVGVELLLALYLTAACVWVATTGYLASLPFMGLFAFGYAAVGLQSLRA